MALRDRGGVISEAGSFQSCPTPQGAARVDEGPVGQCQGRVLVIDDDASLRECLATFLKVAGYLVEEAESGTEGMRRLAASPVDVVLTDLMMPGLSGWEVAQAARMLRPGLPIVLMTGRPDALNSQLHAEGLVAQVLVKPFRMNEVVAVITRLIREDESRPRVSAGSAGGLGRSGSPAA
jgi:DNA-binding response OmpR family regulator